MLTDRVLFIKWITSSGIPGWRLGPTPEWIVDEICHELRNRKLVEMPNDACDRMQDQDGEDNSKKDVNDHGRLT